MALEIGRDDILASWLLNGCCGSRIETPEREEYCLWPLGESVESVGTYYVADCINIMARGSVDEGVGLSSVSDRLSI